jgi:hypothetical protein
MFTKAEKGSKLIQGRALPLARLLNAEDFHDTQDGGDTVGPKGG